MSEANGDIVLLKGVTHVDFQNRKQRRAFDAQGGNRRATGDEVLNVFVEDLKRGILVLASKVCKPYDDDEQRIKDETKLRVISDLHKVLKLMRVSTTKDLKR